MASWTFFKTIFNHYILELKLASNNHNDRKANIYQSFRSWLMLCLLKNSLYTQDSISSRNILFIFILPIFNYANWNYQNIICKMLFSDPYDNKKKQIIKLRKYKSKERFYY